MAKSSNQKFKLIRLIEILKENTDEEHGITMQDILEKLKSYDINAERKSIYADITDLNDLGYDVILEKSGGKSFYKLLNRDFEIAELKLLVDAVQASKFINENQTRALIKKLEKQTSRYEASNLQRQVWVLNRPKNDNKTTLINIDAIHDAINQNGCISFKYLSWTIKKELEPRNGGKEYEVSPFSLVWDDENYYLVAYDNVEKKVKHFRVDKMGNIKILSKEREITDGFSNFNQVTYSKKFFGMYGGEKKNVTMQLENGLIGVVIDRFGKDIMIFPEADKKYFHFTTEIEVSNQFYGWVLGLSDKIKITAPEDVVTDFKKYVESIIRRY